MEIILPNVVGAIRSLGIPHVASVGIAHGNGKMESEDFPFSKPTAKLVRKVDGKTPTPEQTTVKSETVKTFEKIVVSSQGLSETTYVSPHMDFFQGHGGYESEDEAQYRRLTRLLQRQSPPRSRPRQVCLQCNANKGVPLLPNSNCGSGPRNHARTRSAMFGRFGSESAHRRYGYDEGPR
jgi:hypothetical protein